MSYPKRIFGAGHLRTSFSTIAETIELSAYLKSQNISRTDTACRYPSPKPGLFEKPLRESKAVERGFVLDTKNQHSCERHRVIP